MLYHERRARKNGSRIIIGVDEAGRGPLAGPVVVAAVYLKTFNFKNYIDDSKKLSSKERSTAFLEIAEKSVFGIGIINEGAIDAINILEAARLGVDNAVSGLVLRIRRPRPTRKNTFLLLDGTLRSRLPYPSKEIIGGDGKSLSIAAASIVAKVIRDRIMEIYSRIYPQYGFDIHKGYGTRRHLENIARHGLSPIHRKTFCHKHEGL